MRHLIQIEIETENPNTLAQLRRGVHYLEAGERGRSDVAACELRSHAEEHAATIGDPEEREDYLADHDGYVMSTTVVDKTAPPEAAIVEAKLAELGRAVLEEMAANSGLANDCVTFSQQVEHVAIRLELAQYEGGRPTPVELPK